MFMSHSEDFPFYHFFSSATDPSIYLYYNPSPWDAARQRHVATLERPAPPDSLRPRSPECRPQWGRRSCTYVLTYIIQCSYLPLSTNVHASIDLYRCFGDYKHFYGGEDGNQVCAHSSSFQWHNQQCSCIALGPNGILLIRTYRRSLFMYVRRPRVTQQLPI